MHPSLTTRTALTPPSRHAAHWRERLQSAPRVTPAALFGVAPGDRVLVAVAHPDDETLSMGATLASLSAYGVEVHVLCLTRGEAALDHVGVHVPGLAARRSAELQAAADALGVASATVLDLPDSALADRRIQSLDVLHDAVSRHRPTCLATVWHRDPHPDHRAVSHAARAAATTGTAVHELGLWSTHWTDPADVRADVVLLDVDDASAQAKRAAVACYTSQREPLADGYAAVLPDSVLSWPLEYAVLP